jgi:hypothetical protein
VLRLKVKKVRGEGSHPSELVVAIETADGEQERLVIDKRSLDGGDTLVHRSRQKIHPSLAPPATLPRFRRCQGAEKVNLLNASVH